MDLVGERCRLWVVRGEQRRAIPRSRQSSRSSASTSRVRCVSRLPVGSSASTSFGFGDSAMRDQHTLALAHRELLGAVLQPLPEAELLQQRFDRTTAPCARWSAAASAKRSRSRCAPGIRFVRLTDDPELAQAVLVALPARHREDVAAADQHRAAVGLPQPRDQLQQRRLARAARAIQRDELARATVIDTPSTARIGSPPPTR